MPILSVINGGGRKPSAKSLRKAARKAASQPRLRQFDYDAEHHLFFVVPAPSRAEIAKRLTARMKRIVEIHYVDDLLAHVRDHVWRLGWTVFFAQSGPNPTLTNRFQTGLVVTGGKIWTDVEVKTAEDGLEAQATVLVTKMRRYEAMLRVGAKLHSNKGRGRSMVDFAEDLDYFHRKTAKFRDDVLAVRS